MIKKLDNKTKIYQSEVPLLINQFDNAKKMAIRSIILYLSFSIFSCLILLFLSYYIYIEMSFYDIFWFFLINLADLILFPIFSHWSKKYKIYGYNEDVTNEVYFLTVFNAWYKKFYRKQDKQPFVRYAWDEEYLYLFINGILWSYGINFLIIAIYYIITYVRIKNIQTYCNESVNNYDEIANSFNLFNQMYYFKYNPNDTKEFNYLYY